MQKSFLLLLLICCAVQHLVAQSSIRHVRFFDSETGLPLKGVSILRQNEIMAQSDSAGNIAINAQEVPIVAFIPGYIPDTIRELNTVYMYRQINKLPEVIISSRKATRILHSSTEDVIDYDFTNKGLLVLSYSGANGRKAKCFLLNYNGDTAAMLRIRDHPISLFKNCNGMSYCVWEDSFCSLQIGDKSLSVANVYSGAILSGLQCCTFKIGQGYCYKTLRHDSFMATLAILKKEDSTLHPFFNLRDSSTASASFEEYQRILAMINMGFYKAAARLYNRRKMMDRLVLKTLDAPVFCMHDTIVVFDLHSKLIRNYDSNGEEIKTIPMLFAWQNVYKTRALQDEVTGKIYIHRNDGVRYQDVQLVDIPNGTLLNHIQISEPQVTNVKVNDGVIYYLYRPSSSSTRQLFRQIVY